MAPATGSAPKIMLFEEEIAAAGLVDWRKLGQGLHTRYATGDFATGLRLLTAIGAVRGAANHSPQVRMDAGFVDLKLISDDAVYRDAEGTEHRVEWVTAADIDLARRISEIAADLNIRAEPSAVVAVELALDTAQAAVVAPVWSVLLTGGPEARGRGTLGDDVRDATWRTPILWFQDTEEHETPRQRFHLDIQLPRDVAAVRIAAAVAVGAVVVDDHDAPSTTILADPDGNRVCIGTFGPPPRAEDAVRA